jgi:hypothetical protein
MLHLPTNPTHVIFLRSAILVAATIDTPIPLHAVLYAQEGEFMFAGIAEHTPTSSTNFSYL